jgi:hypothetical protein
MADALDSRIHCPSYGFSRIEPMPTDACIWFWECSSGGALLKPKPGNCRVNCSCGETPCPPVQTDGRAGYCQTHYEVTSP